MSPPGSAGWGRWQGEGSEGSVRPRAHKVWCEEGKGGMWEGFWGGEETFRPGGHVHWARKAAEYQRAASQQGALQELLVQSRDVDKLYFLVITSKGSLKT